MRILLAGLLLLLTALSQAQSFPSGGNNGFAGVDSAPQFLPVEQAYKLEIEVLDQQSLRLYWQIADSYYLYQHRFAFSLQDASGKPVALDVQLPAALQRERRIFWLSAGLLSTG